MKDCERVRNVVLAALIAVGFLLIFLAGAMGDAGASAEEVAAIGLIGVVIMGAPVLIGVALEERHK